MRKVKIFFLSVAILTGGLVFILARFEPEALSKTAIAKALTQKVQRELQHADEEASLLLNKSEETNWNRVSNSFYLIENGKIVRWNQNEFLPDLQWLHGDFSVKLLRLPAGDFIVKKWIVSHETFLITIIPLHVTYKISNRYLIANWNQRIFTTSDIAIEDTIVKQEGSVYLPSGKPLFAIELLTATPALYSLRNVLLLILTWVFIGSMVILIFLWMIACHKQRKFEKALLILTVGLIGIRVVMLVFGLPQLFTTSPVFDPAFFASSVYNPSLGDLLLNSMVVVTIILYVFLIYSKLEIVTAIRNQSKNIKWILCIFFQLAAIFSFLFPFLFIETISNNSAIELDITQSLSFDLLRSLAYVSLLLGSVAGFAGTHIFFRMAISLVESRIRFCIYYGAALLLFCGYFLFAERNYWITVFTASGYFLILTFTQSYSYANKITFRSSFYFFLIALAFSVQASFSLKYFVEENQRQSQLRFGRNFLVGHDILGEYLLHESSNQIATDPLIQSRLRNPLLGRSIINDKIRQVYLSSYFDRYDVRIYFYGSHGQPLDNLEGNDFATYINGMQTNANKTEYDGLYFIKNEDLRATKRYLEVVPINYHGVVGGFVVLDLSLKRIIPESVYPELLLDNRFSQFAISKNFSYAFLTQQSILSSFGEFNYEKDFPLSILENPSLYTEGINAHGFDHIGIEDESGRTAIISTPEYSYFFLLTNIAFFFVLGLVLLFMVLSCYGLITVINREQLNYSARIQIYIHLAFLFPLLAVSITTLSVTSRSAQDELTREFSDRSKLLADRIEVSLDKLEEDSIGQQGQIENQLTDLSRLMNVDASLYDTLGNLIASTQPLIFENQLMSHIVNRQALINIVEDKERTYVGNERIGLLQYSASYVSVKSPESGKLAGILCVPFFDSASSLERNQTIVFANIIDIFFVVFILFSILSFFAADQLTFPLRFITKTLGTTSLTGENKPLVWNANDEIGLMVNEYNRMVENLASSRIELARSQKESAWREIAKQVAHEINNPLTPIKLTLQQMDRNLVAGNLTSEKTSQSIKTLLEQVDILNEIASSFSAFARMPAPLLQHIELVSILRKVAELHANEKSGGIILNIQTEPVHVLGDAQLLSRIFSNIILNALQSGKDNASVTLDIVLTADADHCIILFRDDGAGIQNALRDKIFLPHFTTKQTGSGIGLAIAKQGIEQSGGSIWFESTEGAGTTFYIRLPRVK